MRLDFYVILRGVEHCATLVVCLLVAACAPQRELSPSQRADFKQIVAAIGEIQKYPQLALDNRNAEKTSAQNASPSAGAIEAAKFVAPIIQFNAIEPGVDGATIPDSSRQVIIDSIKDSDCEINTSIDEANNPEAILRPGRLDLTGISCPLKIHLQSQVEGVNGTADFEFEVRSGVLLERLDIKRIELTGISSNSDATQSVRLKGEILSQRHGALKVEYLSTKFGSDHEIHLDIDFPTYRASVRAIRKNNWTDYYLADQPIKRVEFIEFVSGL